MDIAIDIDIGIDTGCINFIVMC